MRGCLVSLLLAYVGNGEGFAGDGTESLLAFLLAGKLAAGSRKLGVAIDGGEYPVRFRNEVVDFLLAVYDEGKGRGLDRKSTRLNSSHWKQSRMPSSA